MNSIPSAKLTTGNAVTPLDGRNHHKTSTLSRFFSEQGLNKYRTKVEILYLLELSKWGVIRKLKDNEKSKIARIYEKFSENDFMAIKKYEKETNHDIKAVEYFIGERMEKARLSDLAPYIHLFLTSEDTNNLSYALMLKENNEEIMTRSLNEVVKTLSQLAKKYKVVPMLARTHGQPAVATTVGKELSNYVYRLTKQRERLIKFKFEGKLNGAVGNLNAQKALMPNYDWLKLTRKFVDGLGLVPNQHTTQILFYDNFCEYFQIIELINAILIDLSVNIWQMIMLNIFVQVKKESEVGSSTMPQKINPINFEHAEGNLQLANSMLEFFVRKLTSSRLQRDLSDSTVRRNFGEALGYTHLGWQSLRAGLNKLQVNEKYLRLELENHWEILGEAIQTALRLKKDSKGYEKVKNLTRGRVMDEKLYKEILKSLGLDDNPNLVKLNPKGYIGYSKELVDKLKI